MSKWNATARYGWRVEPDPYVAADASTTLASTMARAATFALAIPATATFVALSIAVLMGRAALEVVTRALVTRRRQTRLA